MNLIDDDVTVVSCSNCKKSGEPCFLTGCTGYQVKKSMTNGDKLRRMTDEQITDKLVSNPCSVCVYEIEDCTTDQTLKCADGVLAWLKEEAKE